MYRVARALGIALVLLCLVSGPVLAARLWSLTGSPTTLTKGVATHVDLTIKNTGGSGGGDRMTCATVLVPSAFSISSVSIQSLPAGFTNWVTSTAAAPGGVLVTLREPKDKQPLVGQPLYQEAVLRISGTPTSTGSAAWQGHAWEHPDCKTGAFPIESVTVVVNTAAPTPTPKPTPAPTPKPTPAPTPKRTARPTVAPTASPAGHGGVTSSPSPTPTQTVSDTPIPSPASSPAVAPSALPAGLTLPSSRPSPDGGGSLGSTAGDDSEQPPTEAFVIPIPGDANTDFTAALVYDESASDWVVPGLVATTPGFFVLLALVAQMANAGLWLPIAKRRLATLGPRPSRSRLRPGP